MPEDILAKIAPRASSTPQKFSVPAIILTLILAIVLILLGERLIFDLNSWINPAIEKQGSDYEYSESDYGRGITAPMSLEKSALAPEASIQYPTVERSSYLTYKLLIHAAFIIPVFLLVFLLYYLVKIKQQKEGWRTVIYGFMIFGFWMMLHLLIEAGEYISSQYKSAAIYIILGTLVIILTPLAVFLQKSTARK